MVLALAEAVAMEVVLAMAKTFSCEHNTHLFTIEDAKDCDVLAYPDGSIVMFERLRKGEDEGMFIARATYENDHLGMSNYCPVANVHPATKEQRDFLYQKLFLHLFRDYQDYDY